MRLIDADELIKNYLSEEINNALSPANKKLVRRFIHIQPTLDAEPVRHGHWKIFIPSVIGDRRKFYNCSVCNHEVQDKNPNYCPNCGTKMDEVTK